MIRGMIFATLGLGVGATVGLSGQDSLPSDSPAVVPAENGQDKQYRIERTVTDKGVRIFTLPSVGDDGMFRLAALIGFGSRHDADDEQGLANVLGRALIESTDHKNKATWKRTLSDLYAVWDVRVEHDYTIVWIQIPRNDWKTAVEWLTQCLVSPRFMNSEVEAICSKIAKERSDPIAHARLARLYPDHALGRPVAGQSEHVESLIRSKSNTGTKDDNRETGDRHPVLRGVYEKFFTAENIVIGFSGHGKVPIAECQDRIEGRLVTLSRHGVREEPSAPFDGRRLEVRVPATADRRPIDRGFYLEAPAPGHLAHQSILNHYLQRRLQKGLESAGLSVPFHSRDVPHVDLHRHPDTQRLEFRTGAMDMELAAATDRVIVQVLQEARHPAVSDYESAKKNARRELQVTSTVDLESALHLCWLYESSGQGVDARQLDSVLAEMRPEVTGAYVHRNLRESNQFNLRAAPDRWSIPWWILGYGLLLFVIVDVARGLPALRKTLRIRRRQPAPDDLAPIQPGEDPPADDRIVPISGEDLVRSIQNYYADEDDRDDVG